MTDWVDEVRKEYCDGKLTYGVDGPSFASRLTYLKFRLRTEMCATSEHRP